MDYNQNNQNQNNQNQNPNPNQAPNQNQYQAPQNQYQNQYPNNQYGYNPPPVVPGKSQATTSLVLGIISLVFCWLGICTWVVGSVIALVLGIVGAVMAVKAKKLMPPQQSGMATAGLVCSIIGIVLSAIFTICSIIAYAAACAVINEYGRYSNYFNSFDW